jgi:hypothetical protein
MAARGTSAPAKRKRMRISADSRRRLKLMLSADGKRPSFAGVLPAIEPHHGAALPGPSSTVRDNPKRVSKVSTAQVLRLRAE